MSRPAESSRWITLVISLPGRRGTTRMRIWRALKATGAAVLRDGVYLLPERERARAVFEEQAQAIRAAGGAAHVLPLRPLDPSQDRQFRALFDRGAEHAALVARMQKLRTGLGRGRAALINSRDLQNLRQECAALQALDFFPGPAASQTQELLAEIELLAIRRGAPGEPSASAGMIVARNPREYRGRQWATRARPWVDRLASAWLIRRFIDSRAKFIWLRDPKRRPRRALGFDFDGAEFTHVGSRVTFETLAASFGLESDPALHRVGAIVHVIDVGGAPVAEAPGLAAVLMGARERLHSDDALLNEGIRIFDHLYANFQIAEME